MSESAIDSEPIHQNQRTQIVAFDFTDKSLEHLTASAMHPAMEQGKFLWIDIEYNEIKTVQDFLSDFGNIDERTIEDIASGAAGIHLSRFRDYIHLLVSGCEIASDGEFILQRIDVILSQSALITVHRKPHFVLENIQKEYHSDFIQFAQTPSFLLYELWDALIEHYADIQKQLEFQVEKLQNDLFQSTDDSVFNRVSRIGENLLHFRGVLMPARTVLTELSTRRTNMISDATQTTLHNMVGTLERILQDVLMDREILTQALNLHMSLLSHRTNEAMSKLTVVSLIFLPLTFLCGVYGMNFENFPEIKWQYGYPFFWIISITIVVILIIVLRRIRLL